MHYYEWNNLIGNLLFNPGKAGESVLLYLTKEQIIKAAVRVGHFETEQEAWDCFTHRLRSWFRKHKTLIDCINDAFGRSQRITVGGNIYETDYPVCLSLLVLSVLPLTDANHAFITQADYYKRASAYAKLNNLPDIVQQDAGSNWNAAWSSIQTWSVQKKKGTWGYFRLNNSFGHIYVGKPFSQCLIPPNALRDLPRAFVRAGWVPRQPLTKNDWHNLLKYHCYDLGFRQAALKTLLADEGIAYSLPILEERFDRWDGTNQTAASISAINKPCNGTSRRTQVSKEDTLARFYLTFPDLNDTEYRFGWQYRIRAGQPLPDTLYINEQTFTGQLGGWSSAVKGDFEEGKQGYDALNKWKVKWPDASIRLFESGQWHGLSSRIWVEVNELSRVNKMWAVCRPDQKDVMRRWGTTFRAGQFKEYIPNKDFDATDWPAGYGLFAFERPTQGLPQAGYAIPETKQLRFVGGLQLRFGMYDDRHRPTLQVVNGDGTEVVTAFTEAGQQITLDVHSENPTLYSFAGDVPPQTIGCRIIGTESTATCQFLQADDMARSQTFPALPGRDAFGDPITDGQSAAAFTGFDVSGVAEGRLHFIKTSRHVFYPGSTNPHLVYAPRQGEWALGDDLLTFLTNRREGRAAHFFDAYEALLTKAVHQQSTELPANVSRYRRWALAWYDTLGYVDYDYELGRVRVLPPALLPVPCQYGHRAIWVGGRSPKLLTQLQQAAETAGVQVFIESQPDMMYMAPSVVSLYSPQPYYSKTYSPIQQVAEQVGMSYLADELPAWRLLERSGSLTDYRATLQPEPEAASNTWTLRVFNPDRLRFERAADREVDHSFALVERQLNAYEVVHYLWIDGQSYRVDKNWGRFLVLHQRGQQVVFRREQYNQIAMPATLPLPRVLARGFALLSGKIPVREEHDFDGTPRAYLLYDNAGSILSGNYIQKLGQELQSTHR